MEIKEIILSIQSSNQKMVDQAWMELIGIGGHDPNISRNNSIIRIKVYKHLSKKFSIYDDNICDSIYERFIEKLMKEIPKFEVRSDGETNAWFWQVLRNVAKDYFKAEEKHYEQNNLSRNDNSSNDAIFDEDIDVRSPINDLMTRDLADCIDNVLENQVSNEDYVIAYTERYINGESVEYIQSLLNRPSYSSTTTMINAAVKKIVPMLDECKELV